MKAEFQFTSFAQTVEMRLHANAARRCSMNACAENGCMYQQRYRKIDLPNARPPAQHSWAASGCFMLQSKQDMPRR